MRIRSMPPKGRGADAAHGTVRQGVPVLCLFRGSRTESAPESEIVRVLYGPIAVAAQPRVASEHVRGDVPAVLPANDGNELRDADAVLGSILRHGVRSGTGCCSASAAFASCPSDPAASAAGSACWFRCSWTWVVFSFPV